METHVFFFYPEMCFLPKQFGQLENFIFPQSSIKFFLISQLHLHLQHLMDFQVSSHIAQTISILLV